MDRRSLAMSDSYHLTWENASFDLDNKNLPNPHGERIHSSDRRSSLPTPGGIDSSLENRLNLGTKKEKDH